MITWWAGTISGFISGVGWFSALAWVYGLVPGCLTAGGHLSHRRQELLWLQLTAVAAGAIQYGTGFLRRYEGSRLNSLLAKKDTR